MTMLKLEPWRTGRITNRSSATPMPNAATTVMTNAAAIGTPLCTSCQAMYVVNIANSP